MSLRLTLLGVTFTIFGAAFLAVYSLFIPFFVLPTFLKTRLSDELVIERGDVDASLPDRNLQIFRDQQWPVPSSVSTSTSSSSSSSETNESAATSSSSTTPSSSSSSSSSHNYSPYTFFYLFEVSNPKEVVLTGASPRVVERGPFGYLKITQRSNLSFSKDNTENTYDAVTSYRSLTAGECLAVSRRLGTRAPKRACQSDTTEITTFNPAIVKLLGSKTDPSWIYGKLGQRAMKEVADSLTSTEFGLTRNLRLWRLPLAFQMILQQNLMWAIPQLLARVTLYRGASAMTEFVSYLEVDCGPDNSNRLTGTCPYGIGRIMYVKADMVGIRIDDANALTSLQARFLLNPTADQSSVSGYPPGTGAITVTAELGSDEGKEQLKRGFIVWMEAYSHIKEVAEGKSLTTRYRDQFSFLVRLLCLWRRATEMAESEADSNKMCEVNVRGIIWYLFGQVEVLDNVPVYKGWFEQDVTLESTLEQWRGISSSSSSSLSTCKSSYESASGEQEEAGGGESSLSGLRSINVCDWSIRPFLLDPEAESEVPSVAVSRLLLDPFETYMPVGSTATTYPSLLNPYKLATMWGGVATFCQTADLQALGSVSRRSSFFASATERNMSCSGMTRWATVVRNDLAPSFALADGVSAAEYDNAAAVALRAKYERMVCSVSRYVQHWAVNGSW